MSGECLTTELFNLSAGLIRSQIAHRGARKATPIHGTSCEVELPTFGKWLTQIKYSYLNRQQENTKPWSTGNWIFKGLCYFGRKFCPGLKKIICHKLHYSGYVWEKVSAEFHFCSSRLVCFTKTNLVQEKKIRKEHNKKPWKSKLAPFLLFYLSLCIMKTITGAGLKFIHIQ